MQREQTIVIVPCGIDNCTKFVAASYERGEPQTMWHPGEPDWWYPYFHGETNIETFDAKYEGEYLVEEHLTKLLDDSSFQTRCGNVAAESFDNDVWIY